jgi:hypothetical protein
LETGQHLGGLPIRSIFSISTDLPRLSNVV